MTGVQTCALPISDETFIGSLTKNMHKARKERAITGTGGNGKAIVMGVLRRGEGKEASKLKAEHIPDTSWSSLTPLIYETAAKGSHLHTDEHKGYYGLKLTYVHKTVTTPLNM